MNLHLNFNFNHLYLTSLLFNKLPLVFQRTLSRKHLKIFMKTCKIIESTFIAKLFDAEIIFNQQFAGMPDTHFDHELGIGLSSS